MSLIQFIESDPVLSRKFHGVSELALLQYAFIGHYNCLVYVQSANNIAESFLNSGGTIRCMHKKVNMVTGEIEWGPEIPSTSRNQYSGPDMAAANVWRNLLEKENNNGLNVIKNLKLTADWRHVYYGNGLTPAYINGLESIYKHVFESVPGKTKKSKQLTSSQLFIVLAIALQEQYASQGLAPLHGISTMKDLIKTTFQQDICPMLDVNPEKINCSIADTSFCVEIPKYGRLMLKIQVHSNKLALAEANSKNISASGALMNMLRVDIADILSEKGII